MIIFLHPLIKMMVRGGETQKFRYNCQLIYNASSFISLLGVGAGVIISVCPLIIMTRGDAETPVIPEFYDWFNVPHSQQLGLKPNHFSEKRAPKWILKHFLFKLAIDHPCTSGTRGTSLSPLLASSILWVILGLSWSVWFSKSLDKSQFSVRLTDQSSQQLDSSRQNTEINRSTTTRSLNSASWI